jgi:nucleoside-diphosphate-sugar epimerase
MNILVTGASGFVGRGLLPLLAARGHHGVATGRSPPSPLPAGWEPARRQDVLVGSHDATGVDAIVHLEVRQHIPRPTAADIDTFELVNVGGTREWLDWASRHGVRRFVFVSTIKAVHPGRGPTFENAGPETENPYGLTKARAEKAVRGWAAEDPSRAAVILRPAPVYGPAHEANLAAFVRQVVAGRPCLVGRGDAKKSIVSRNNLAAAIEFATTHARPGCDVFNVSDRETMSLGELAATIADVAGAPPPSRIPEVLARCIAPFGDLFCLLTRRDFPLTTARLRALGETTIFPCDKLVAAGFSHPQSTREGLAEMLAWTRRP